MKNYSSELYKKKKKKVVKTWITTVKALLTLYWLPSQSVILMMRTGVLVFQNTHTHKTNTTKLPPSESDFTYWLLTIYPLCISSTVDCPMLLLTQAVTALSQKGLED